MGDGVCVEGVTMEVGRLGGLEYFGWLLARNAPFSAAVCSVQTSPSDWLSPPRPSDPKP